ncbi:hypothetical protein G7Y79_00028g061600 [Physcia stellaris]|nr:hypothetical protein G7Y79_00028g061600 [Physcia stellaris]
MSSPTDKTPNMSNGSGERRRSSGSSPAKFASLMNQKRNSSDATATARKASFAEQSNKPGVIGSMWQSFTKGNGK